MVNKLSQKITEKLLESGIISEEEQELYIYGLFILISTVMYFVLNCIFGLMLGCFFESVIFFTAFQFIRKYAGGYHAATETRCEIMSTISLFACIVVIRLSRSYDLDTVLFCISLIAAAIIALFSPLDTPEKPLSEKEFKYFRKISWIILFVITAAAIITYCVSFDPVLIPCCLSLILESILLSAGKIKKSYLKSRAKK